MSVDDRVRQLREAFDGSFAEPPVPPASAPSRYLGIRVGGDALALRIEDLQGVDRPRRVVPVPGGATGMLGIVGLRGRMVCVFSLQSLLGSAPAAPEPWIALVGGGEPVGLAFAVLDGYLEADAGARREGAGRHVSHVLEQNDGRRGVLDVPSLLRDIRVRGIQGEEREG